MPSTAITLRLLQAKYFSNADLGKIPTLNELLRLMGRWRATLLANTYVRHHGKVIFAGPFAGMEYLDYATEGCLVPRLLGCYEDELHDDLRRFADEGVDTVVDIGCAEGYYAVGLARMISHARVHAFDIDPRAREACQDLAKRNGVEERVTVRGEFTGDMFAEFVDAKALVIIDAEGFEDVLMRPDLHPALKKLRIIMETHPMYRPGIVERMYERFSASHDILVRQQGPKTLKLPQWLQDLGHLDHLLAVWEFRSGPTPWFVMTPHADADRR